MLSSMQYYAVLYIEHLRISFLGKELEPEKTPRMTAKSILINGNQCAGSGQELHCETVCREEANLTHQGKLSYFSKKLIWRPFLQSKAVVFNLPNTLIQFMLWWPPSIKLLLLLLHNYNFTHKHKYLIVLMILGDSCGKVIWRSPQRVMTHRLGSIALRSLLMPFLLSTDFSAHC